MESNSPKHYHRLQKDQDRHYVTKGASYLFKCVINLFVWWKMKLLPKNQQWLGFIS